MYFHFNEESCQGGLDALGWYHEKKDEVRGIGLGPDHDWSSHGADAFRYLAVRQQPPKEKKAEVDYYHPMPSAEAWMQ